MPPKRRSEQLNNLKTKLRKLTEAFNRLEDHSDKENNDPEDHERESHNEQENEPGESMFTPDVLSAALGEAPSEVPKVSEEINDIIAQRWTTFITSGLKKETKKELIEAYPAPKNCPALKTPVLNEEIEQLLNPEKIKQDKFYHNMQQQIEAGLTALGQAIHMLTNERDNVTTPDILQKLGDAGQLFTDTFRLTSAHRRYTILPALNDDCKKATESSTVDEKLFGSHLQEKVKAAQAVKNTSAELKKKLPIASTSRTGTGQKGHTSSFFRSRGTPNTKMKTQTYRRSFHPTRDRERRQQSPIRQGKRPLQGRRRN
ncbi:hypothetical protein ABEB36_012761 [Hypothenemus hampei]|uniref:Uncharacterized protein n=1 Tax=Hypothenemus hampei TaxID=57062 RepID=A0ABD1EEF5_HYPHA